MSAQPEEPPTSWEAPPTPKATNVLLTAFTELYRYELGAGEDVFRTLPFFGTALGVDVAAVVYAAGTLPS
ncbi:MAG: hypothetical protein M0002_08500 [Rhodospirillales bacterium]|nr:hypothetical protein [Rhodospirillales bacterium]